MEKSIKLFFTCFIIILSIKAFSQRDTDPSLVFQNYSNKKPYYINIEIEKKDRINFPFYVDNIIDSTDNQMIGLVRTGIFNVQRPAYFKLGTQKTFLRVIQDVNDAKEGYLPLKIVISKVKIFENLNAFNANTNVIVTLRFYSLGILMFTSTEQFSNTHLDGTSSHKENIKKAIINNLNSFTEFYYTTRKK
ncbi:MAG: hypothetical protein A2X13_06780 [Bacteroidetes bacterium GWC2_33_15]|nr:MAG: hypothetical protein A2X10_02210 [Bacteroidetes bacterium GWA2_33_15]OFX52488.1 MAG: hypothetical protein A2X13_06780 [Bacteroidetes bacterium GWC2_33_15]OFX65549.1 MAG: hypothetical protein A2X15_14895 [Bacteroidetes bacterium GWB2_32_14]OFX67570.1 MAG: hypothetical protein A2X14_11615 [Bacteroidetes bacterium GWD2_33_33]HAN18387.1 hypothetical protein [Bacteroidales bacterium]